MIDVVRALLESSPLLALFLAIAGGCAIGQISIAGVSFGADAVLFTGLAAGAVAPRSAPPAMVGTLGLVMLVYGVGVQYAAQFFASLRGPGFKYMALSADVAALGVAVALAAPLGLSLATAAGLFAGSGTSTPTLQAALAVAGNEDPAIGYSVAYPFGVLGPIVLMSAMAAHARRTPPR